MSRLDTWISGRGWCNSRAAEDGSEPASAFARRVLNRRLAKIRARTKAVEQAPIEELHRLRIAIKKVRYGFEFFQALLPPKRAARTARLLKTLQDSLGHLNDLDVAKRTIAELTARRPPRAPAWRSPPAEIGSRPSSVRSPAPPRRRRRASPPGFARKSRFSHDRPRLFQCPPLSRGALTVSPAAAPRVHPRAARSCT
jgi:hypothetical protein